MVKVPLVIWRSLAAIVSASPSVTVPPGAAMVKPCKLFPAVVSVPVALMVKMLV